MIRSLAARLILVTLIVMVGLALTFALDEGGAQALEALPEEVGTTMGQSHGLFYAIRPGASGQLYLSEDGRGWRALAAPPGESLQAVATHDPSSNLVYAVVDEALWVTTSGGESWQPVAAPLHEAVSALATDSTTGAVYATTRDGPLYRVSEAGASVMQVSGEGIAAPIRSLTINPVDGSLFAATDAGLMRSTDAGKQWERVEGLPTVTEVVASPSDPRLLFAATRDSGLFRSLDGGQNWEAVSEGLGMVPGASLAITALMQEPGSGALYVATANVLGHTTRSASPAALYLSPDGGTQWIRVTELDPRGSIVTALLPEQGPGSGVRAVSSQGVTAYRLDADQALLDLQSEDVATRLNGAKVLSVAAVPTQAETILPYLRDEDGELAYYVARALGQMGGERVTAEMSALVAGEEDTILKLRALMALHLIADPATVPPLTDAFREPTLSRAAADALAAIGTESAWEPLLASLADAELTPQRQAAMVAIEMNSAAALPALLQQLNNENPVVRANTAQALAWSGQDGAIRPLRALLEDSEPDVRASAAFALGELGDRESVRRLTEMSATDPDPAVREAASRAIPMAEREPSLVSAADLAPSQPQSVAERLGSGSLLALRLLILTLTTALALFVLFFRRGARPALAVERVTAER